MLTVTNNSGGGSLCDGQHPRSEANLQNTGIPLYIDACASPEVPSSSAARPGYADNRRAESPRRCFVVDGSTMSAEDGLANMGGFLCTDDDILAQQEDLLILTEGFPSYGGLAGRDLEAIAVGSMKRWTRSTCATASRQPRFGTHIGKEGVPIVQPPGGHAIYWTRAVPSSHSRFAIFRRGAGRRIVSGGGIRSVEIGSLMFGDTPPWIWCAWRSAARVHAEPH